MKPAQEQPNDRSRADQLSSWKSIAAYLDRSERTVRRWEQSEGLPVHRHGHEKQDSVYAFAVELDAWLKSRSEGRASTKAAVAEGESSSSTDLTIINAPE